MPKYNVAVVGAGLGGLAAAALLSRNKKKVVLLERGGSLNEVAGLYEKDGFIFHTAPSLSYGFERGGDIQTLSASLGIVPAVSVPSPCYQVALPDRRITVFPKTTDTLEELRREFPNDIDALVRFYRDLHKEGVRNAKSRLSAYLVKHRSAAGFIRKYRFSRELMVFFDIQSFYFFHKPTDDLTLASLIILCDTPPQHLRNGFKGLADQMHEIILHQGGEVLSPGPSPQLAFRNSRVIGITTSQGTVEARVILLNSRSPRCQSTLFIGLRDEVVPIGMCREVLFLPDYAFPREFIALSLSAKDDGACAPPGMRTLCASFRAQFRSQRNPPADKQTLIEYINRLMPFLDRYCIFAEEYKYADTNAVPLPDIYFKPLRSTDQAPLLSRGSNKNVYLLNNAPDAPLQVLSGARQFVKKMI